MGSGHANIGRLLGSTILFLRYKTQSQCMLLEYNPIYEVQSTITMQTQRNVLLKYRLGNTGTYTVPVVHSTLFRRKTNHLPADNQYHYQTGNRYFSVNYNKYLFFRLSSIVKITFIMVLLLYPRDCTTIVIQFFFSILISAFNFIF